VIAPARLRWYACGMLRALLCGWLSCAAFAQTPAAEAAGATDIPSGKAELQVRTGPVDLQVFTYRPASWSGQRLLFVMHGVLRNADEYRDHAVGMADRFDALVVAPKFDNERFPSRAYQRGGLLREDGSLAPKEEWTYARIPELAAAIRMRTCKPEAQLYVIGHSAGGQFVVRMSAFQDTGAVRLVAANPGSVLLPTTAVEFGYGFGGLPVELANDDRLRAYVAAPLTLYLGTGDDHDDEWFDKSPAAMAQGSGRHQRGLALYWTAKALAESKGWQFGWRLVEAVGVEHDHEKMFENAMCEVALFGVPSGKPGGAAGK
jgi:dienelactone hydrolase